MVRIPRAMALGHQVCPFWAREDRHAKEAPSCGPHEVQEPLGGGKNRKPGVAGERHHFAEEDTETQGGHA